VGKKPPGAGLLTIQSYAIAGEAVYGVRRLGDPAAVTPGAGLSAAKALAGGK
jgi:hypothetical protein